MKTHDRARARILGFVAALVLAAPSSAEVTFRLPPSDEPEEETRRMREEERRERPRRAQAPDRFTASTLARMSATPAFWRRFGDECERAYLLSGFGDTMPEGSKPADRLAALLEFENCLARFSVELSSQAEEPAAILAADSLKNLVREKVDTRKNDESGKVDFLGLRLGVGVGISHSQDDVIPEAVLGSGGVIVATKDDTTLPRVILESHYFGWCKSRSCRAGTKGIGPYFGIVAKSDKLISAFSAGVLFGWKDKTSGDPQGFSIGIGVLLDDDVKSLAKGFEEGRPLPAGETEIRFVEKSRWSGILFFTRTF